MFALCDDPARPTKEKTLLRADTYFPGKEMTKSAVTTLGGGLGNS